MLCERTIQGELLPENVCLLAACNPYKLRNQRVRFNENVGIKRTNVNKQVQSNLLYHVYPLPDNIIEYVWDFGSLTQEDYKKYIGQMLKKS